LHDASHFLVATEMASTLKDIAIRWPISLYEIGQSGIPALIRSAGTSLHDLYLTLSVDPLLAADTNPSMDLSKLVNLRRIGFAIYTPFHRGEGILADVMLWICDRLATLPQSSPTLCDFILRLNLHSRHLVAPPVDGEAHDTSDVRHFRILDNLLSNPPFMGVQRFVLEIQTYFLKATHVEKAKQLASIRFPKLAARGILRVVVIDNLDDTSRQDDS